jgi:hypothetical protein
VNRNDRAWPCLAWGDREWSLNDGQIPYFRVVRVALGMGYNRVEGTRRTSRNGLVSDLPPEIPNVAIRNLFPSLCTRVGRHLVWWKSCVCNPTATWPRNPLGGAGSYAAVNDTGHGIVGTRESDLMANLEEATCVKQHDDKLGHLLRLRWCQMESTVNNAAGATLMESLSAAILRVSRAASHVTLCARVRTSQPPPCDPVCASEDLTAPTM